MASLTKADSLALYLWRQTALAVPTIWNMARRLQMLVPTFGLTAYAAVDGSISSSMAEGKIVSAAYQSER